MVDIKSPPEILEISTSPGLEKDELGTFHGSGCMASCLVGYQGKNTSITLAGIWVKSFLSEMLLVSLLARMALVLKWLFNGQFLIGQRMRRISPQVNAR